MTAPPAEFGRSSPHCDSHGGGRFMTVPPSGLGRFAASLTLEAGQ